MGIYWNYSEQLPIDGLFTPEENSTTKLQTLGLWEDPIGSEGAVAFADSYYKQELNSIDLGKCNIQGEGAVCLAKALEKNFHYERVSYMGHSWKFSLVYTLSADYL